MKITKSEKKECALHRQLFYNSPIVVVDGITRTGKSMLGPILTSFEGVELERMEMILERIPQLYLLGKITEDAAVALLRIESDMMLYESMLSRNINFRLGDHSSVFSQVNPWRYVKRIFTKEGDTIVKKIHEDKPIFQVQLHDLLGMSEVHFKAFEKRLHIVEMIRHPVDLVYSQYKRGYGQREDNDPRIFSFNLKYQDQLVPWYCNGWETEDLEEKSPINRTIKSVAERSKRLWSGYEKLDSQNKSQVLFIPFEKFVTNPHIYIPKIEQFVGRKATKYTPKALKQQKCPRHLDESERANKLEEIKKMASPECVKILEKLSADYERIITTI